MSRDVISGLARKIYAYFLSDRQGAEQQREYGQIDFKLELFETGRLSSRRRRKPILHQTGENGSFAATSLLRIVVRNGETADRT